MANVFNVLTAIVLLAGIYAFLYTYKLKKKGVDFAIPYVGFILCWNLWILERFVFGFFAAGAFHINRTETGRTALIVGDSLFSVLAVFGSLYFFVKVLTVLSRKGMPRKLNVSFSLAFVFLSFVLGFGTGTAILDSRFDWLPQVQSYSVKACLLLLLIFTIVYNQKNKLLPGGTERNRAVAYGKFYSTAYFVLSAIFILSLWNLFSTLLVIFLYLLMNFFPSVWHRASILDAELERKNARKMQALEKIRGEYGLTPREEEVCLLVLEGLDDQEIQESLEISLGTVKRHLSNIKKKLGVSRREELLGLFDVQIGEPVDENR